MFLLEIKDMDVGLRRVHYDDDETGDETGRMVARLENKRSDTVALFPVSDFQADVASVLAGKNMANGLRVLVDFAELPEGDDAAVMKSAVGDAVGLVVMVPQDVKLDEKGIEHVFNVFGQPQVRKGKNEAHQDN